MAQFLTIGHIGRLAGMTPDTIRYYERVGLLPAPSRSAAGYRQYTETIVTRLALVRNAQRFGFSLRQIAAFLRVRDAGGKPCHDVRAAATRMLEAVDAQIDDLVATRTRMRETLRTWDAELARTPADRPARLLEHHLSDTPARSTQRFHPPRSTTSSSRGTRRARRG
jgi:DNA-binding transcriptional MerR regulator